MIKLNLPDLLKIEILLKKIKDNLYLSLLDILKEFMI